MVDKQTAIVAVAPNQDTEVQKLQVEILKVRDYALAMVVKTPEEAKLATNDLSIISNLKKDLEIKRKEFIFPHKVYINSVNDAFKLISEPLLEADKAVRDKVIAYKTEQERLRQQTIEAAEAQRIADAKAKEVREATGELVSEQTEAPVEIPVEVSMRVHGDLGTSGMVMNKKWEVEDFNQVPERYKEINSMLVGKVIRAGGDIPGIRVWEKPSLRVTTKKGE